MALHTASATINHVSIPLLLDWWQQRKRLANARGNLHATLAPKGDETYLNAYYRLMEIYSVVKSGGVQVQKEAVEAFAKREGDLLHQRLSQIAADPTLTPEAKQKEQEMIEQELNELRCANEWRLQTLSAISPEEEALVRQNLSAIESTLMQLQCA